MPKTKEHKNLDFDAFNWKFYIELNFANANVAYYYTLQN